MAPTSPDTGILSLSLIARFHGVHMNPDTVRHELAKTADQTCDTTDLLRAAKQIGLKAKAVKFDRNKLTQTPLPALLEQPDGTYLILAKAGNDKVLLQDPTRPAPITLSFDELEALGCTRVILVTKRAQLLDEQSKFGFAWFFQALKKYKRYILDVLIASFFIQILALASPLFFQVTIDKVLVHNGLSTLDVLAIGFIAVSIFDVLLNMLRTYVMSHTANRIDVTLGSSLFSHLVHLPVAYFKARRVGDTVARVRELENVREFITGSAVTLIIDTLFTLVFFAVMYYYSPTLTFVVMASVPCYLLIAFFVTPVLRKRLDEKFRLGAENQSYLVESVSGVETVKSLAMEPRFRQSWDEKLAAYTNASFAVTQLGNLASNSTQLINKGVTIGILWFGAQAVLAGELTVGQLIAVNILAGRISGPILRLAQLWQDFQQIHISVQRLGDILDTPTERRSSSQNLRLPKLKGQVQFEHITFRYQPDRPAVLNNINLTVKAGEVIGIVGRSGSGKSTLTKLVQRLYVPESGRVLVDGTDISLVDPSWLRQQVGVVLQENFLFNRSIRDNIALTDPGVSDQQIVQAATLAGAHEFIVDLPEGYDTVLGEQGAGLSGGQKQRIAIARALLTNPRILIFDEATSALDYESEAIIQRNMRQICQGRTVFVIAHRLSTVRNADRIIVMDQGRIVESGHHNELINAQGYYAKLNAHQAGRSMEAV